MKLKQAGNSLNFGTVNHKINSVLIAHQFKESNYQKKYVTNGLFSKNFLLELL
jgi:hypothetical protein